MKKTTLCLLVKNDSVLLAMKKRGFGAGKWNGVGGKVIEGETMRESAVREAQEEIGVIIKPADLIPGAILTFSFQDNPTWDNECHVYLVRQWEHEPAESEEMRPQWYSKDNLPFNEMWIDDQFWLPEVLKGKQIHATFLFNKTGDAILSKDLL